MLNNNYSDVLFKLLQVHQAQSGMAFTEVCRSIT